MSLTNRSPTSLTGPSSGIGSSGGGGGRPHKQSMAELKLRRLTEHNTRLKEELSRSRIRVSEASNSLIAYCQSTKDPLLPSVWGPVAKGEDPYAPVQQGGGCCVAM